jgi:poly-gamma-glutamate capsule biosynthesis protein CapA/YwtB (metallophosphatase superfamily)
MVDSAGLRLALMLFLCGDFMSGRGIDQALPHSVDPALHEEYVKDARAYLDLAEEKNGPLPRPLGFEYIWGDALAELKRAEPDVRIVNLETAVTRGGSPLRGKGIHYRMHPDNIGVLTAARIDCAVLANNHVLDWGDEGLRETLSTLERAGVRGVGAGADFAEAERPAVFPCHNGTRVVVYACGLPSSGIPPDWAAREKRSGVNYLPGPTERAVERVRRTLAGIRREGDVVIASIHWGGNWGYDLSAAEIQFAHRLIDEADVHVVHGHSSHHPKGIEVYRGRLVLYGCGDFFNDYEGIGGHESYRPDLSLMYFPEVDPRTGSLISLRMAPMRIAQFRLGRASQADADWLAERLDRESRRFGVTVEAAGDGGLRASWK